MKDIKSIFQYIVIGILAIGIVGLSIELVIQNKIITDYKNLLAKTEAEVRITKEQLDLAQQEVEKLSYENITKMDPADVVDRYLNDDAKQTLLAGADKYTALIVDRVFQWLERTLERDQATVNKLRGGSSEGDSGSVPAEN